MEQELPKDFKELLKLLNSNEVEYLVIGGYAVIIHGYVRNTSDLDIVVSRDRDNAEKCVKALQEFGFAGTDVNAELFSSSDKNVARMGFPPVKIEILNYLEGVDFQTAYSRKITKDIEDMEIDVISLEDLISNKVSVGRLQDQLDVEKLRERNKAK
ncbi:MAG: DUF6036 family nucleotidyltransferase [Pyrinomonadaceae bacterium]